MGFDYTRTDGGIVLEKDGKYGRTRYEFNVDVAANTATLVRMVSLGSGEEHPCGYIKPEVARLVTFKDGLDVVADPNDAARTLC